MAVVTTTQVAFHPTQPIIGSCSSDKAIYLGEIDYTWDTKSGTASGSM